MSPKGHVLTGLVPSWWHCWEVMVTLALMGCWEATTVSQKEGLEGLSTPLLTPQILNKPSVGPHSVGYLGGPEGRYPI
jgi:hypothetical protein